MEEVMLLEPQNRLPKIYSKLAVRFFAFFFSAIFGGILLTLNLRDIGKKKEANIVLIFSILYTIAVFILAQLIDIKGSMAFFFGLVSAVILSDFFYAKYIPNEKEYPKKKIWKPLIIAIFIAAIFIFAIIFDTPKS